MALHTGSGGVRRGEKGGRGGVFAVFEVPAHKHSVALPDGISLPSLNSAGPPQNPPATPRHFLVRRRSPRCAPTQAAAAAEGTVLRHFCEHAACRRLKFGVSYNGIITEQPYHMWTNWDGGCFASSFPIMNGPARIEGFQPAPST